MLRNPNIRAKLLEKIDDKKFFKCKACDGTGLIDSGEAKRVLICIDCNGDGVVDWVENAISKVVDESLWEQEFTDDPGPR